MTTMSKGIVAATVVGVVVAIVVAIKNKKEKHYSVKEESFGVNELENIIARGGYIVESDHYMGDVVPGARTVAKVPSTWEEAGEVLFRGRETNKSAFDVEYFDETEGEVETLRKGIDPNSLEAMAAYVNMKTAGFLPRSNEDLMIAALYEIPFTPIAEGDRVTFENILYDRRDFFGEDSKWCKTATWGDVIMYYAERISYNLEDTVEHWASYIINNLGFNQKTSQEEIEAVLEDVRNHDYVSNDTGYFGMFALDDAAMAYMDTQRTYSIHKSYSFEMELNALLNMAMEDDEDE